MFRYGAAEIEREDLNRFEDIVTQDRNEDWSDEIWGDTNDFINPNLKLNVGPSYLNNQDYTLNSPLIPDELNAFKEYLIFDKKAILFYNKSWDNRKDWMRKLSVDWSNTKHTNLFHNECAKFWMKESRGTEEFKNIILQTDKDAKETYVILETYLKKWSGRDFSFKSRSLNAESTLKYGSFMWEMLKISWLLNAGTKYERDNLKEQVGFEYLESKNPETAMKYISPLLGTVYIGDGIIYLEKINMIWDRAMLLMFKDTSTARFHTLLAIQHRYEDPYHSNHFFNIDKMYTLGDLVLTHDTQSAYESYGMIEPLSSLKLSELAASYRPLIPSFPHFRDHVTGKIEGLKKINPHVGNFFKHLNSLNDKRTLLTVYGSFRHWGHPFIDYLTGLKTLYQNVTSTKDVIDKKYAELLASDLAFKVLKKEYWNKYKWFVDYKKMDEKNPLYDHIKNHTWPSVEVLQNYPAEWHLLPLLPCWEIPEVVDPAIIYSDKTHSINKTELIDHLRRNPNTKIPTRKVLETLITTKSTDWPAFLKEINDKGLEEDDLIIGLKAKEREIKWKGRYFALMSWRLREYFVFTEYLIKKSVIPLFRGLTMADDQNTLIRKMLENTSGQGGNDYKKITIANHIDYEKWNNFQRFDATAPVFLVLGKFFGLPNLFLRTHEFFQDSLIYYRDRPDLMKVENNRVVNRDDNKRVCWNGQLGGLEGLRQKGWSVLNLLVIERESRIRNTQIKILAQGDNQVICTQYEINPSKNDALLRENIEAVLRNNAVIIDAIRKATARIGLRINEDETLQAADMLIYGKSIIFRGNITCLEEKRYSRITCTTNDQLPSLGNVLATVSTNCLTISHYSKSPINAMMSYNWLCNFVILLLSTHNPALRAAPKKLIKDETKLKSREFRIAAIYLDPSLGGLGGMSLTRFHLRMFPDPVTESLSFWKIIYHQSRDQRIKQLAIGFGNPKLMRFTAKNFEKLVEDPASLNLPRGLSAQNLIKEEIKRSMMTNPHQISHEIIRDAVTYVKTNEQALINWLSDITPCFPRFLSEVKASTYIGLTESILGLFVNSKTIRNMFKKKFMNRVDQAIVRCELGAIEALITRIEPKNAKIWACSASQADSLRFRSWNRKIIGTTVPHPSEMISNVQFGGPNCSGCSKPSPEFLHLIVLVPQGLAGPEDVRGPFHPYLGSSTGETTSLIQSWERDTDISFLRKASKLRIAFNWFVDPTGNLGRSINANLKSMTGEDPGETITGFKRTGSSLHRYGCSRVSAGGYIANSPVYGSRMIISTDVLKLLGDDNYDFMYQALMLYAQQTVGAIHGESEESATYHFHISCKSCLRKIEEPKLEAKREFPFKDVSQRLSKWKCTDTPWMNDIVSVDIPEGNWNALTNSDQAKEIGVIHGVIFGNLGQSYTDTNLLNGLFPIGLRDKLYGSAYLLGLMDGLYRAATIDATHRRVFYESGPHEDVIRACYITLVNNISSYGNFLIFSQGKGILHVLKTYCHRIPASYPLNNTDLGVLVRTYLLKFNYFNWRNTCFGVPTTLWIFADFMSVQLSGVLIIAYELSKSLSRKGLSGFNEDCKGLSDLLSAIRSGSLSTQIQNIIGIGSDIKLCTQEVRHAVKFSETTSVIPRLRMAPIVFENEVRVPIKYINVDYSLQEEDPIYLDVPRIQNPLISGLRIPQIATGSFLKIEALLSDLNLRIQDALIGGDGSGGIGASVLRKNEHTRIIFNSLLKMEDVDLGGTLPSPPSAINYMVDSVRNRCVNLHDAWSNPMDLSKQNTWISFKKMKEKHHLRLNLAVFDMEVQEEEISDSIDKLMVTHLSNIMDANSTVIIKSYIHRIIKPNSLLTKLGCYFHNVMISQNLLSSSHTSEVYLIFQYIKTREIIRLYPRWSSLKKELLSFACFKAYSEEFSRAIQVLRLDLIKGIPNIFLPDPVQELAGIWNDMAHDKVTTSRWMNHQGISRSSSKSFSLATLYLLSNQVLNTTAWRCDKRLMIPGDQILSKFFAYFIGTYCYIALITNNEELGKTCQYMIDEPFLIYFYQDLKPKTSKTGERFHSMSWSLSELEGWVVNKKVFVQDKLAMIGSVIRYWTHQSKLPGPDRLLFWYTQILLLNKKLTRDHLEQHTGLYDIFNPHP
nr:MAG: polymerase [Adumi ohlsrhavirus]